MTTANTIMPSLTLADASEAFPILVLIASFFAFWILLATIDSIHKTNQRERTAREIAAYVAEGSISAADAGHMLESQNRAKLRDRLTELVAEQWIDVETARKILGEEEKADFVVTAGIGPKGSPKAAHPA
jgi:hypothetical protein